MTVGRRWFWGGHARQLRGGADIPVDCLEAPIPIADRNVCPTGVRVRLTPVGPDDPAAIIFTTGSTGPPKGVLYTHGNFDAQVDQIRDFYGIRPGEVDLPCFPLFGLFNCAMGVTAVIPDMDPSRPAQVDPAKIIEAAADWNVDAGVRLAGDLGPRGPLLQGAESGCRRSAACFRPGADSGRSASPHEGLHPSGRRRPHALRRDRGPARGLHFGQRSVGVRGCLARAYDLVQAGRPCTTRRDLPARLPNPPGAGVCVGRRFSGIRWKVIRIVDGPIRSIDETEELPAGEIGELIVRGPQVTRQYVTRVESNALAKIADGATVWHRMGDCGYLDEEDRFWFCGRVAHRVLTAAGPMYPVRCEAIFNQHPDIRRSALVGVGPAGPAAPGDRPGAARRADAKGAEQRARRCWTKSAARRIQPADRANRRLPAAPRLSGRHPPQREDFPRKTGRLGGQAGT